MFSQEQKDGEGKSPGGLESPGTKQKRKKNFVPQEEVLRARGILHMLRRENATAEDAESVDRVAGNERDTRKIVRNFPLTNYFDMLVVAGSTIELFMNQGSGVLSAIRLLRLLKLFSLIR